MKKYGDFTLTALKEVITHSETSGEGIDSILGDEGAGCSIIKDLIEEIETLRSEV